MTNKSPLPDSWFSVMGDEFEKEYIQKLRSFLKEEQASYVVYPPNSMIFNAFQQPSFEEIKVVVLGQDPYHGPNQAHGLCFSVQKEVKIPPSLRNIYKEIQSSLGLPFPKHGELTHWAEQGVFLLNTVLTVRQAQPKSHEKKGWEIFTDRVILELSNQREGLVFVLWGSPAQKKEKLIDKEKHLILESPHPSPLSASRGFFGNNHFVLINEYLENQGKTPIDWSIPD